MQHGDGAQDKLQDQVREAIKDQVVGLMIALPEKLQFQLSDAVSTIAATDFPEHWESLMDQLVSKLSPNDYKVNVGVLQTAHSIFKKYRHEFRTDALFLEIKFVLDKFAPAFLQLFQNTDALITQFSGDAKALQVLFQSILLMTKIFYSLNSQDIPEFFEDHQQDFMPLLLKYLVYVNPLLTSDDEEAGILEKVRASICEIAELYSKKYEELFSSLAQFVQTVWELLTSIGMEARYDHLVSTAITFLSSVAKHARHRAMFESPQALQGICEKIILPNIQLRDSDVELFEDDPIEYIRRDLEGSDSDTRRRSATDLVRSLCEQFEQPLTTLFGGYVSHYLQQYSANPLQNWKDKDTANYLLIAITAKSATSKLGAIQTNAAINITDVFSSHVYPDLNAPVDSDTIHPVLKVDALKFLNTFRHQLTKEQLLSVFPLIVSHLTSKNYVVHTYAAVCIERILSMKSGTTGMFTSADVRPFTETLLTNLFSLIEAGQTPEKISENDYLLKTVIRVIFIAREDMKPYALHILGRLTKILEMIAKNPSNPKFNHYMFEAVGSLVRFTCAADSFLVGQFESLLFPPIQAILQLDIPEFTPYVLQILSQLLEFHNTTNGIPEVYQPLLQPLMSPALWDLHANVPALVRLLQAFLARGGQYVLQNNLLPVFLGIFQKLTSSRLNDHHGFELLESIVQNIELSALQQYLKGVFNILLMRLQSSKTAKYINGFLKFVCKFIVTVPQGAQVSVTQMDSIQPQLFKMVFGNILLAEVKSLSATNDRKVCTVALIRLCSECPALQTPEYSALVLLILENIATLLTTAHVSTTKEAQGTQWDEEELLALDVEEAGYQSAFSRLHSISKSFIDPVADVQDLSQYASLKLRGHRALTQLTGESRKCFSVLGI